MYLQRSPDTARYYAEEQLKLAQRAGLLKQESSAYNNIAVTHHIKGDLEQAIPFYQLSLDADVKRARSQPGDVEAVIGIASSHSNMGILRQQLGDLSGAMQHYERSLHLLDSLEAKGASVNAKIAGVQNSIGLAHETQKNSADALLWYRRAEDRYTREEPSSNMANTLGNIGNAMQRLAIDADGSTARDSLMVQAQQYYDRSLKVREGLDDRRGVANSLNNIAVTLQQQAKWSEGDKERKVLLVQAEEHFRQSAVMAEAAGDRQALASTWGNLAENLLLQGRADEALRFGEQALALGRSIDHVESIQRAAGNLHAAYKRLGRIGPALQMHELYMAMRDSVRNDENTRNMLRQQYAYDYAQREALLVAEQEKKDAVAAEELRRRNVQRNAFIGGFMLMLELAGTFLFQRNRINKERRRSEELLLNILPEEVAEELKERGEAQARHFDSATILFTDFKGFTQLSEQVTPAELVAELNTCFKAFDAIMTKYRIEKIKTIGDAYMAAGGLPDPKHGSPADVVHAALEMQDFMKAHKAEREALSKAYFEMRVGIHTGPVVAGIVGVKKFQYDIWGDTVNTASRMESSGEVGKVNISEATYRLVKDVKKVNGEWSMANGGSTHSPTPSRSASERHSPASAFSHSPTSIHHSPAFTFTPRGKIQAKGKGEMEMYFVERKVA
ncbi:MAG: tetratricopeptide repeat protein [Flavobacteriales bacterium]|nr:tetratricopeptide repeat protein [Flavobacteriales bacterium]